MARKVLCKVGSIMQSIQDEQRVSMSCINHTWSQEMGLAWQFVQLQNNLFSKQTKIYYLSHSACRCLILFEYPLGVKISHWHIDGHSTLVSYGGLLCFVFKAFVSYPPTLELGRHMRCLR